LEGCSSFNLLKRAEGAAAANAALFVPIRTDSVNRGLSISRLTLAMISRAISIRLFFFMTKFLFGVLRVIDQLWALAWYALQTPDL
jgi:hypothetical protein